jgi:hypothetical protein
MSEVERGAKTGDRMTIRIKLYVFAGVLLGRK